MSRWTSDSKQRASKRYKAVHDDLRLSVKIREVEVKDKRARKRERSRVFHQTGGLA